MNSNYPSSGSRRSGTLPRSLHLLAAGIGAVLLMLGSPELRADEYDDTIKVFKEAGQSGEFFKKSYGYAVFPKSLRLALESAAHMARAVCTRKGSTSATPR